MRSGLVNSLRAAKEANTTTAKLSRTNDAAAEPSSSTVRHLSSDSPASASRHSSSPSPRPQDTALPLSNRRPAQQADLPDLNHPSLKQSRKYQISEDEYRLCANFSVPEDFTPVPSPEDFLLARINATMVKPTSEHSYKPINSLHESGNQVIARSKPRTYSNKRYNHIPGGFMEGQNQYRSRKEIETPGSSRSYINLDEQPRQLDVSGSAKRRKLRHNSSPQEVINLDDDDDIQNAASSPLRSTADTVNLTRNSPSIVSSQLQSRKSPSLGHVPPSEFENTNRLVDPRRKKARKSPANGTERQVRTSPDITVNPARMIDNSRHPVSVVISRRAPPREQNSRKLILEDLQQGKDGQRISAQKGQHQLSANPGRTSEYWPNAEINESTELRKTESRKAQRMKYLNSPPSKSIPVIEDHDSEDELHTSITEPSFTRTKGRKSIMRSRPSADELSNASIWPNDEGWPLNFARSHDFEMWGPDLWLRKGNTKDSFRVVGRNSSDGVLSESTLNLQKVNLVKADCSSRIRLQGGQSHGQNIYLFDLEFANLHEFNIFYAFHAEKAAVTASKNPSSNFEILFSKPLPKNEKIRKLSSTEHSASAPIKAEANMNENRPRGEFMNKLFSMKKNMPAAHTDESDKATARISSTRPTRTTRANGPVYAEVEEIDYPEVEKFSEVHGLGKPWDKPLQYGSGRRRALVEFTDLPRLDEGEFLNDSLIDFYMIYLFDQAKVPADKVYYHNTHFYSTLTRNTGRKSPINYQAVKRWTSKDDIFSHDYIMVPINEAAHWYLAIICNVSNIARKPAVEEIDDSDQEAPKQVSDVAEILPAELDEDEVIEVSKFTPTDTPSPSSPVPEVATEPNNDPNLFEEANIDLIKPDAIERDQSAASGSEEGRLTPAETIGISQLSLEDDSIPKSIFSDTPVSAPAKKKTKRKSGPILRKRNPDEPVIIILDSLGISRTGAVKALKQYILEEGKDKRGMDAIINEQGFYAKDSQIPMQENLSDCGVYLLGYTQKFFEDPDRFKTRMLTGEMTTESDWPDMAMPQMRATMREILFKLNETQREERRLAKRGAQKKSVQTNASKAEAPKTVPKQEEPSKVKSPQLSEEKRLDTLPANSTAEQATESPLRVPILRLGSPFSPRRITRKEQSLGPVNKVSDSPPILRSSPIHHHARIGHQVTIATTSPTARKSPRKRSREEAAITEDALSSAIGQPRRDAHPTSPKKRFVEATDGEKANTEPTRKKRLTSEPPPTTREHVQTNVADEPGSRPGTSDHPIPIDDSQDQSALALHSSTPARLHSKHRRTRSTETPRTARAEPLAEDAEESTTADEAVVAETPEYERSSPRVEEE